MEETTSPASTQHGTVDPPKRQRRARLAAIVASISTLALVLVHLAGGWYFSGRIHEEALDAGARRAGLERQYDLEVAGATEASLSLIDPDGDARRPGVWGVAWPGGYGLAGEITAASETTVTRRLEIIEGSVPASGVLVDVHERAFPDDPAAVLGESPQVVIVDGPLGEYASWFYPGQRSTWALLLHGNGLDRLDLAKLLPTLRESGFPVLIVTMRNDPGAPEDPSGMLRYGDTEWADLEAAVRYATGQGADGVVLLAPSMGGGVALTFLERSVFAGSVEAVVLDSPLIDFGRTIDARAADEGLPLIGLPLPGTLVGTAKWLTTRRFGVDWDATGHLDQSDQLVVPVLIFHGTEDHDVPIKTSRELAAARPDLVSLVEVPGAPHLASWNLDPAAYEAELIGFLERSTS